MGGGWWHLWHSLATCLLGCQGKWPLGMGLAAKLPGEQLVRLKPWDGRWQEERACRWCPLSTNCHSGGEQRTVCQKQEEKPLPPLGSLQHLLSGKFNVPVGKGKMLWHPRRPVEGRFGTERQICQLCSFTVGGHFWGIHSPALLALFCKCPPYSCGWRKPPLQPVLRCPLYRMVGALWMWVQNPKCLQQGLTTYHLY